jgi:aerobic carbon-monoxide dehydrogenase large subunit
MTKFGFGQAVPRTEDARLLTGRGRYTDDITLPGQLHAAVLRSPHAHADILSVDASAAREAPGVRAVFTGMDLEADGIGHLPCLIPLVQKDGKPLVTPERPALATGRVRHVGDAVALVVADTPDQARDAIEMILVDYADRPATADLRRAVEPGAPQIWDEAPGNRCFLWESGDAPGVDAGFAKAAHVVALDLVNNRVVPTSMEGRACNADFDAATGRMTLYVSSQGVHALQKQLAQRIFKVPQKDVRVVTTDVGGGFGMKIFLYPEYVLALYAARKLGRPVKWTSERTEAFLSDDHGRDNLTHAELALDEEGRFLALRVRTLANMGAYLSNYAPFIPTDAGTGMLPGVYTVPAVHVEVEGVFTNTQPVDAYRGAGRPEAAYVVERMADAAARSLNLSPAEIRRRNFIPPDAMPYTTAMGITYDSGDFRQNMEDALVLADWDGIEARREEAGARGRLRGIGLSTYIEACAGGGPEQATVQVTGAGKVTLLIGTQSNGQGHETAYTQILSERFGIPPEDITVVQGDTERVSFGAGTGGSRSAPVGGAALSVSADKVIQAARAKAAELLEAAEVDIDFEDGTFTITGTDRRIAFTEVARAAAPAPDALAFDEVGRWTPPAATYPNGCHVCEVEIDTETGTVEIVRYTVVDDFGKVLNPLMLAGQIHGGIAQGAGQALMERCVFDPESGQLLTGSLMDYALPRADLLPRIALKLNEVPCRTNMLGMKGAGEAGAIGAPPAIVNALVDALGDRGITHLDMPATPERVWNLLQGGLAEAAD